jgi:hypothetical protein
MTYPTVDHASFALQNPSRLITCYWLAFTARRYGSRYYGVADGKGLRQPWMSSWLSGGCGQGRSLTNLDVKLSTRYSSYSPGAFGASIMRGSFGVAI